MPRLRQALEFIGVCFDGSGRALGQAAADPTAGRRIVGCSSWYAHQLGHRCVRAGADPGAAGRFPERAGLPGDGRAVYARVQASLEAGRFPVLYGGDCAVLLGALPALRDVTGTAALLFVDGHEDATTMEQSTTGEAANMEIALLLGLSGEDAPEPLRSQLPVLGPDAIEMLGQRDATYRQEIGAPTIADRVRLHDAAELRGDPKTITARAAARLAGQASGWWLTTSTSTCSTERSSAPAAPPAIR